MCASKTRTQEQIDIKRSNRIESDRIEPSAVSALTDRVSHCMAVHLTYVLSLSLSLSSLSLSPLITLCINTPAHTYSPKVSGPLRALESDGAGGETYIRPAGRRRERDAGDIRAAGGAGEVV